MRNHCIAAGFAIVLSFVVASAQATPPKGISAPSPSEKMPSPAEAPNDHAVLSGNVVETMNAGGYTYALIEKNGKKTWVAVPETKITVGRQVTFQPGQEMKEFTSKSLNRTFETIVFSGGVASETAADPGQKVDAKHAGSKAAVVKSAEKISVEKARGPNSYTVAEIFSRSKKLNKKTALVKARVVKVSAGIMGRNWIHLQDGTGDASRGTSDLIATSQELPAVGDVITMKGIIYKDKDFGSGYKYTVIMENASIQK